MQVRELTETITATINAKNIFLVSEICIVSCDKIVLKKVNTFIL